MPWPRAVLFDLDDTLVSDDGVTDACWILACERYWRQTSAQSAAELREAVRRQADWFYSSPDRARQGRLSLDDTRRNIVSEALRALGLPSPELGSAIADAYSAEKDRSITLVPGAVEALAGIRKAGVRLGLVSNGAGEVQRRKVDRFGLGPLFNVILIEGEFGLGKPEPSVYASALTDLGADPSDAWMVGDHLEFDVAAPQRLGLRGIWVDYRGHGVPAESDVRPDLIIRAVTELDDAV